MVRRFALALLCLCFMHETFAQTPTSDPAKALVFDAVSIRPSDRDRWSSGLTPDGYRASGATLQWIITSDAYDVSLNRLSGGPSWFNVARWDVVAKVADSDVEAYQHLTYKQRQQMLRAMLADRFHLVARNESRPTAVYALRVAKEGLKLTLTPPERQHSNAVVGAVTRFKVSRGGAVEIENGTIGDLARWLSGSLDKTGRFVVDGTGLAGRYDIKLHWTPDGTPENSPLSGGPSIFTAIEEQVGLKLEPATAPIDFLVIDHVEQPTAN